MKLIDLQFEGKEIRVPVMKIKGKLWFHYDGECFEFAPESKAGAGGGGATGDPSKIQAPMPGKIIKILVSEGDSVSEGQTLVAMEAMKMEYNLKSLQDMKVKKIKCQEQQSVSLGDTLLELEEIDG